MGGQAWEMIGGRDTERMQAARHRGKAPSNLFFPLPSIMMSSVFMLEKMPK